MQARIHSDSSVPGCTQTLWSSSPWPMCRSRFDSRGAEAEAQLDQDPKRTMQLNNKSIRLNASPYWTAYTVLSPRLRRLGSAKTAAATRTRRTGGQRWGWQHDCAHRFMPLVELILRWGFALLQHFFHGHMLSVGEIAAWSKTREYRHVSQGKVRHSINIVLYYYVGTRCQTPRQMLCVSLPYTNLVFITTLWSPRLRSPLQMKKQRFLEMKEPWTTGDLPGFRDWNPSSKWH